MGANRVHHRAHSAAFGGPARFQPDLARCPGRGRSADRVTVATGSIIGELVEGHGARAGPQRIHGGMMLFMVIPVAAFLQIKILPELSKINLEFELDSTGALRQ